MVNTKNLHTDTLLATLGLAKGDPGGIVNTPVCRASTLLFESMEAFEAAESGTSSRPTYGRFSNPTNAALEKALAELDGADHALTFSSGLASIVCALMAFLKTGDHVLITDNVYTSTRTTVINEFDRLGIAYDFYDPTVGEGIEALMKPNTRVVYVESPGSLTFEVQDVPAIARVAHAHDCVVIADNTWATPIYYRPFDMGIDISMHSATKYISGHSDILMGVLTCKAKHYNRLLQTHKSYGACATADSCYLALRGLRSMRARMERQQQSAIEVAEWFKTQPSVEKVLYPMLPDDPFHALWKRDMTGGASLFSVIFKPCDKKAMAAFIDSLQLFGIGFSWGGFESLLIPFDPPKVRSATTWPYKGQAVRFHIGLEAPEDLIADLAQGLKRLVAGN